MLREKLKHYLILMLPLLFLFGICGIHAEDDAKKLSLEAEGMVEVHRSQEAQEIYSRLLKMPLDPWQRAIVSYNNGNINMLQKQWADAIEKDSDLLSRKNLSPQLIFYLRQNLAISLIEQARTLMQSYETEKEHTSLLIPLSLLKESLYSTATAQDAYCNLMNIEGFTPCPQAQQLPLIKTIAKQELSSLLALKAQERLSQIQMAEGIEIVSRKLRTIRKQLKAWQAAPEPKTNLKTALLVYQKQLETWKALLGLDSKDNPQLMTHLQNAENAYRQFLGSFEPQNIEEGLNALTLSLNELAAAKAALPKLPPLVDQINYALNLITDLLNEDTLQKKSVELLHDQLERIAQLIPESELQPKQKNALLSILESEKEWLQDTLDSFQSEAHLLPIVFLTGMQQGLQRSLQILEPEKPKGPDALLKLGIVEQKYAFDLTMLVDQISSQAEYSQQLRNLLTQAQQRVIEIGFRFPEAVLRWQHEHFYTTDPKVACEKKPWDQVMPLFYDGFDSAQDALKQIDLATNSLVLALDDQKETIQKWQEALETLQKQQTKSDKSSEQQQQNSSQSSSQEQILQNLREMDLEDRPTPNKQIIPQAMDRPW